MKSGIPVSWDLETDVLVVGFGGAGSVAAIKAKDAGSEVIIIEKQSSSMHTPSTMMCGGGCQLANDAEGAAKYFKAVAFGIGLPGGYGDPATVYPRYPSNLIDEITHVWSREILKTGEYLKSLDITFKEMIPSASFTGFPGYENCGLLTVEGHGIALFRALSEAVYHHGIEIKWETRGKRLLVNSGGEVIGLVAQQNHKSVTIKARKAVILTTGGFEHNQELKKAFLPGWGWSFIGNPGNTGDGLMMAMGVGAALGHMHHCAARVVAGGVIADEIGTAFNCRINEPGKMLVDNYGLRYCNEELASNDPDRYHFYEKVIIYDTSRYEYPRIPSWFIFDEQVRKQGPVVSTWYGAHAVGIYEWSQDNSVEIEKGWILKGNTIEDLANKISNHLDNKGRMKAATLVNTIRRFNSFCGNGIDVDFGRRSESLGALMTPPYYAIAEYPGGPNTEGGPIKNAKSQIINVFGDPIPRLYAAGEVASIWSFLYQIGGNIAECIISGTAAGKNAAAEEPWT